MFIQGEAGEGETEGETPLEGEGGCEVLRARKVRNGLLLRLWEDLVQGQVDLARVTCAGSCGRCMDLTPDCMTIRYPRYFLSLSCFFPGIHRG